MLIGGITWLVVTESGLTWLTDKAQTYAPGELTIEQVQGRLIDNFKIEQFSYQYEEIAVQFDTFQFVWQPKALADATVHIKQLHLNGLKLHLPKTEKQPPSDEPIALPDIHLPVRIVLEDVQVRKVSVQIAENEPIIIDSVDLITTTQEQIQLQHFSVQSPQFQVTLAGNLAFQPPYPLQLDLTWSAHLPNNLSAEGQGTLSGDIKHLILSHTLNKPTTLQAKITVDNALEDLRWTAALDWDTLQWPLTEIEPLMVKSQQAKAQLKGTLDNYQFTLQTDLSGSQIPASQWNIKAKGDLSALQIQHLQVKLLDGEVNASGQVTWYPELQAQLNLQAKDLTAKPYWAEWPNDLTLTTELKAAFQNQTVNIEHWQVNIPEIGTETLLQGKVALTEKNPIVDATLTWEKLQWPLSGQLPLVNSEQGNLEAKGTLEDYQVKLATHLSGAQLSGQLLTTAHGDLSQVTIEKLDAELLDGTIQASGRVAWQDALNAQFKLSTQHISPKTLLAEWPADLSLNTQIQGEWSGQTLKISECEIAFPQIPTQLSLQGKGTLTPEAPEFEATVNWQNLQWPLTDKLPLVRTEQGKLTAQGTPKAYQFKLFNIDLTGKDIPTGQWQATGQGNLQSVQFTQLQGKLLQGTVNLAGQATWQPTVTWQATLNGKDINPGQYLADWPGKLVFALQSQGELKADGVHTQVTVKNVQGTLRDYPLKFQTQLTLDNTHVAVKDLQFHSGNAQIYLDGKLFPQANANWKINASDLSHLLPQLQGQLKGQGQLSGELTAPKVIADLEGKNLVFEANQLGKLAAQVNVDLVTGKETFTVQIVAEDFTQGSVQVDKIQLKTQGQLSQHTLETQITLPKETLTLQLAGSLDRKQLRWQGQLKQLALASADFGTWQSTKPADLLLSAQQVQLTQQCLKHEVTQLCMQARWQQQADSFVQLELTELPLDIAQTFLPPNLKIKGNLNGKAFATLQADGSLRSQVKIDLSKGTVQGYFSEVLDTVNYQGGTLQLAITEQGLTANVDLGLLEQSKIKGNITLPNLTRLPLPTQQPLTGQLQVNFADLQLLPLFVHQVANPQGQVSVNLAIAGDLAEPQISGLVQIQNGALEIPNVGLDLQDLHLTVKGSLQEDFQAKAQVRSGKGILRLTGQAKLNPSAETAWEVNANLKGEQVEVANIPSAWVLASPDIDIHIAPKKVDVKGKVTIPQAMITPAGGGTTGAVTVSDDVVIVNSKTPISSAPIAEKWAITSQVQVILGDKVAFEGMGLKAHFRGALEVSNRPNKETVGHGELQVVDGTFKGYGQNLQLEKSRIIFTGGPITNPGLDMRAVRHLKQDSEEDISAGLRIQGTAKSPQVTLFSQPTFDQTNTLSYILLGKPAAQASDGEGQLLVNAVSSLPLKQGDNITKKIANRFGFDEAGISSEGNIEEAALVLGKYLSPRLYISYGIGLFENVSVFRMRYDLTKRLKLETETGTQSGVDLHYTIEW